MKRSEFFGSQSANEAITQSETPKPAEGEQGSPGEEQAPAASEDGVGADPVFAATLSEPNDEVLADAEATPEELGAFPAGEDALAADVEAVPEAVVVSADVETVFQGPDAGADGGNDLPEGVDALPGGACAVGEGGDPVPVDMTTSPAADPSDDASGENAGGQAVSPQASDSRAEPTKNDEMILVWRPDHRKTPPRREREARHSRSEAPGRSDVQGATPVATPRNWRRDSATHPPMRPNRPNSVRADEKRRQRPKDYDMARTTPTTAPQKPAKVDPNSPFAKLLELRSLLEEQANKRR